MTQASIKAVFFDAGNTLFTERRSRPAVYLTVARAHGGKGSEEQASEAMQEALANLPTSVEGNFRFSVEWFRFFNDLVMDELGVSEQRRGAAHEDLLARFESPKTYKLFKEVPAVLGDLVNRGLVVGVVSNWSERLPELLKQLGVADSIQFVVASAEIKSEKPDRAIFDRALFRAGVSAEETLHVGDNCENDVRGALSAGLRAALLDRQGNGAGIDGVPVLSDLRGVLALIDQPAHASRD